MSFIQLDADPGTGPRLHHHPYQELPITQEGQRISTDGDEVLEESSGHAAIVRAASPNTFVYSGAGILRQIDIPAAGQFATAWLEKDSPPAALARDRI